MAFKGIKYKVDYSGFRQKTKRIVQKVNEGKKLTTKDIINLGVAKAKSIAPHYSGRTATYIQGLSNAIPPRVIARNPTSNGQHRQSLGSYPDFNLVKWMHLTNGSHGTWNPYNPGGTGKHIGSGDPRFMYTTRDYLNNVKGDVAGGNFKRVLINI